MQRLVAVAAIGILAAIAFEATFGVVAHNIYTLAASSGAELRGWLACELAYVSVGGAASTAQGSAPTDRSADMP